MLFKVLWESFFAEPQKKDSLKEIVRLRLKPVLTKAFRESVDHRTLNRYANFAMKKINTGQNYTKVMKEIAAAIISSPKFLSLLYDRAG